GDAGRGPRGRRRRVGEGARVLGRPGRAGPARAAPSGERGRRRVRHGRTRRRRGGTGPRHDAGAVPADRPGERRAAPRRLHRDRVTQAGVREAVDAGSEKAPAFWDDLAAQGLLGLHLPESVGGAGYGMVELAVVVEELGRVMTPGPFLPTVLASAVLHRAGSTGHLPALAGGGAVGAVGLDAGSLVLTRSGGTATVTGTSGPVMGGPLADVLVLPAADAGGVSWVALTRDAVQVEELPSHDLTRRLARITCRDAA